MIYLFWIVNYYVASLQIFGSIKYSWENNSNMFKNCWDFYFLSDKQGSVFIFHLYHLLKHDNDVFFRVKHIITQYFFILKWSEPSLNLFLWTALQTQRWLWWGRGSHLSAPRPRLKKTVQVFMIVFPFLQLIQPMNKNIPMHLCSGKLSLLICQLSCATFQ